ncbi:hypothetical protein SLS62_008215 [Diatrype stigma]|uniref:Nuclear GTPase SLIP-GC n=1 Tax=Diatrype stigma TaxID=117547 RepID=A0AAN9UW89_9PEZI
MDHRSSADRTSIKSGTTSSEPMETTSNENGEHTFPSLQEAMASTSVESLEHYTTVGINAANDIIQCLNPAKHSRDAFHWMKSLEGLLQQSKRPQYILGVIGATGHGKSSLINSLLGEAQLVPTNCMRACTAVVTEVSWNPSENPNECYVGHIEFISVDEWRSELDQLFSDLTLSSGELVGETNNKSTDAGVAWAKIKAVYPRITSKNLAETNADTLINDPSITNLLGSTKTIYGATAKTFYKDIRTYVDSKQKPSAADSEDSTHDDRDKPNNDSLQNENDVEFEDDETVNGDSEYVEGRSAVKERIMELWPLIKVVKIQTKADVLSTGATIVDLPGVEDSNAARAAIASKYIEKCHGIWIVASIQRAVDDNSAQNLLGRSFKQQMQLDGNLSNISFICSKTDDISIGEAVESLGLHKENARVTTRSEAMKSWEASNQIQLEYDAEYSDTLSKFSGEIDRSLSQWEKLELRQRDGKPVRSSEIILRKRKASSRSIRANKRQKLGSPDGEDAAQKHSSFDDLLDQLKKEEPHLPGDQTLDGDQIRSMIEYLRSKKNAAIDEKEALDDQVDNAIQEHEKLCESASQAQRNLEAVCIRRRNEYARETIRNHFALGLKELDQDATQQEDPELFDPEELRRDYEDVANKLRNMNSLRLWAMQGEDEICLTDEEKQAQVDDVKSALVALEEDIKKAVFEFVETCHGIITNKLFKRLQSSVAKAIKKAPKIAEKWPSYAKGDGGLPCLSYRATCRRMGVFSGKNGPRDFNEDLIFPLKQRLANSWEQSFTKKIPEALEKFTKTTEKLMRSLHKHIKAQLQQKSTFTSINILQTQLQARAEGLTHMAKEFNGDVTTLQREANRGFHPAIMGAMSKTYQDCAEECGRGCFERMKKKMNSDLRDHALLIFNAAADPVKSDLTELCLHLKTELEEKTASILDNMTEDYSNLIAGRDVTKESKNARREVALLLEGLDALFEHALRINIEPCLPGTSAGEDVPIKRESE